MNRRGFLGRARMTIAAWSAALAREAAHEPRPLSQILSRPLG